MRTKKVLGMPAAASLVIIAVCLAGIVTGSFLDYEINVALADRTPLGSFIARYSYFFAFCMFAAAGGCLFKGLRKKGGARSIPAWVLLAVSMFLAVHYSGNKFGQSIRELFGYKAGESAVWPVLLSYLFQTAIFIWIPLLLAGLLDDTDPDKLIAVGAAIIAALVVSIFVNDWLKDFASRPRYKYLITLDDPRAEYRNWWQMIPYKATSGNEQSWPSGHMTAITALFALPMIVDCMKKRSRLKTGISFGIVCAIVLTVAHNRISMTNHFLTDVCFAVLFTYMIFAVISTAFLKIAKKKPED